MLDVQLSFGLTSETTSCACLDGSGLKLIFHWKAHSFILSKSSQSLLAVAFGSFINVSNEVSSAKSFGFIEDRLYKLKKQRSENRTLWNSSLIKPHDNHWLFSKTRYFLLSRKFINNCNKFPQISLRNNLEIASLCHTFSKALDISRKTPLTSNPSSKPLKILWVIAITGLIRGDKIVVWKMFKRYKSVFQIFY